jgi:hypothetical protein
MNEHKKAMVEPDNVRVPLVGIEPAAVLQECDLCHEQRPLREVELNDAGQFLCWNCRGE